ncbi:IS630 family transposase, partial [Shewanella sp. SP2S2-4]|nr:IS630 family transposase [Shewanella sp. SP2S2-4]
NAEWYYAPELNPMEPVWQWLGQNVLANRRVSGYGDIVEQCSIVWNERKVRVIELRTSQ